MKRLIFLTLLIFVLSANSYSLTQFTPKTPQFYIDFSVKDLDKTIKTIATKFVSEKDFLPAYERFKSSMIRDLKVDITDEESLKKIGINVNAKSGVVLSDFNMSDPQFFIAIAAHNPGKCRDFFFKLYKNKSKKVKEKIMFYKNMPINIIEKKSYKYNYQTKKSEESYKEDFVVVNIDEYILISNRVNSIKVAIDNYVSGENLAANEQYQNVVEDIKGYENYRSFMVMSGDLIDKVQNMASALSGQTGLPKVGKMYHLVLFGMDFNENEIAMESFALLNKEHQLYPSFMKLYQSRPYAMDLFSYLPQKRPYMLLNFRMDSQLYLNDILPSIMPSIQKEFKREFDKISRELNIDFKTSVLDNIGNSFILALYDYDGSDANMDSMQFMKSIDFVFLSEVVDSYTLEETLNKINLKLKKETGYRKRGPKLNEIKIEGFPFYEFGDDKLKFYYGNYQNHLVITTRKARIEELITNVIEGNSQFLSVYHDSDLAEKIAKSKVANFVIDIEKIVKDSKMPEEIKNAIEWKNLGYLYVNGGIEGDVIYSKMILSFN